jgi:hypothetical protein
MMTGPDDYIVVIHLKRPWWAPNFWFFKDIRKMNTLVLEPPPSIKTEEEFDRSLENILQHRCSHMHIFRVNRFNMDRWDTIGRGITVDRIGGGWEVDLSVPSVKL